MGWWMVDGRVESSSLLDWCELNKMNDFNVVSFILSKLTIRIGADLMQEMNGGHEQKWVAQGSEQKVKR